MAKPATDVRALLRLIREAPEKLLAEWFWIDRWMGSSAFLLPVEARGLYTEMLRQSWRREGSLPNDHEAIRRACGVTIEEWERCWPRIAAYWVEVDGGLVNETQLEVMAKALAAARAASERAAAAANARWAKHRRGGGCSGNARAPAPALLEQCSLSLSLSPSLESCVETPSSSSEHDRRCDDDGVGVYVAEVLRMYTRLPGTRDRPSRSDRETARELHRRGVSLEHVRTGLVLATARRGLRQREEPLPTIGSLTYFLDAIEEAREVPADSGYTEHLCKRLQLDE